jgi:hypothetical protein
MPVNRSSMLPALALCAAAVMPATSSANPRRAVTTGSLPTLQAVSPLATAMPGAHVPVSAATKGRSARTRLTYLLSADRRPSATDHRLGTVAVPALRAGATRTVRRTLTIPARGRIGSWYLLGCAGAGAHPRCTAVPLPVLAKPSPRSVSVATDATHSAARLITAEDGGTQTTYDQTLTGDNGTSIRQQSTLTIKYAAGQ